jgi:outer membrane protein OmpA-like peptidoglycan-associated protein
MNRLKSRLGLAALAIGCLCAIAPPALAAYPPQHAAARATIAQAPAPARPAKPAVFRRQYLIFFEVGSAAIPETGERIAAAAAAAAKQRAFSHLKVIGYSDAPGSTAAAQKISEQRAAAVRQALIRYGIPADKIRSEGRGKHNPAVKTAAAEPRNRRVRIIIYMPGE